MERNILNTKKLEAREIHFFADATQMRLNTPLQRLSSMKGLIANGLLNEEPVTLVFSKSKSFSFPSQSVRQVESFTRMVRLMGLLEENLTKNYIATRRDVFYQDVETFHNQLTVDTLMELLTRSMGLSGDELGAVASQKGLFHGDVILTMNDGTKRDLLSTQSSSAILIPRLNDVDQVNPIGNVDYILVVEKEAVFNALINTPIETTETTNDMKRIVITGKGFPDVLSRQFLHMLTKKIQSDIPVFGISDFDPYGFQILRQFITGGKKATADNDNSCCCPLLQLTDASISHFVQHHRVCCLDLPLKDFLQCRNILCNWSLEELQGNWRREVQRIMYFGKKAELDVIKTKDQIHEEKKSLESLEICRYIDRQCRAAVHSFKEVNEKKN